MPRPSSSRQVTDMYWFAHGGVEQQGSDHSLVRESTPGPTDTEDECSENSSPLKPTSSSDEGTSSGAAKQNVDRQDSNGRTGGSSKRLAVEERKRQIMEAEQVKNEAILKKHAEREAALEARRNAQRSNISFAFGKSLPANAEFDIMPVQLQPAVHSQAPKESNNLMTMSMTSSLCYTRGRRKNDLTPTVPYDRTGAPVKSAKGETRKRSVSMSRLDALAQPRRHYVEAQKAGSTMSSSSASKDVCNSPKRPLSSASDKSNKSGRATSTVTRRVHTTARKPRPVSIAGSIPDSKPRSARSSTPLRSKKQEATNRATSSGDVSSRNSASKHSATPTTSQKSDAEKLKATAPSKMPLKPGPKPTSKSTALKQATPKTSPRKLLTNKKQAAMLVATSKENATPGETVEPIKADEIAAQPVTDEDSQLSDDKSATKQHIISEEEAKAALAEKRRLAREQAEKEAAILRQQEEEQERERERQRLEEEEQQRRMEEEQLRLLEEHKQFEEEKLQKAIEEQERKDEEERNKREEEARLKAEQEKKAKEEAEKQRLELEEKLRKEEEERAERKKRLEKIMSRTRGKSGTASPSGSLNGSEPLDACENQPLSSEPSSLDSNEPVERSSPSESLDINQALYLASESLSSNDLMLPSSERTSLDGSLQAFPSEPTSLEPHTEVIEECHSAHLSEAQSSESEQDQHSQSSTYPVDQKLESVAGNINEGQLGDGNQLKSSQDVHDSDIQAGVKTDECLFGCDASEKSQMHESDNALEAVSDRPDAFFQQVESEYKNELQDEVGAKVGGFNTADGSSSQAFSAEVGDSHFFKQVESKSVNSTSEKQMFPVAQETEAAESKSEAHHTGEISEADNFFMGSSHSDVPGTGQEAEPPTVEGKEIDVPDEMRSTFPQEQGNEYCSSLYLKNDASVQELRSHEILGVESTTWLDESFSATSGQRNEFSDSILNQRADAGKEFAEDLNFEVKENKAELGIEATIMPSQPSGTQFGNEEKNKVDESMLNQCVDLEKQSAESLNLKNSTENQDALYAHRFETTTFEEVVETHTSDQQRESCESIYHCDNTREQFAENMEIVQRVESPTLSVPNVETTIVSGIAFEAQLSEPHNKSHESVLIESAEARMQFSDDMNLMQKDENQAAKFNLQDHSNVPVDYNEAMQEQRESEDMFLMDKFQKSHETSTQQVHNSASLFDGKADFDDFVPSKSSPHSDELSQLSFQDFSLAEKGNFAVLDQEKLSNPSDIAKHNTVDLPTEMPEENVHDPFSISHPMLESTLGSNFNPFSDGISKSDCDSTEVPGADTMSKTLIDQSSDFVSSGILYVDNSCDHVPAAVSQNVNPFAATADLSTSVHSELLKEGTNSVDNINSSSSAQNKPISALDKSDHMDSNDVRTHNPFGIALESSLLPPPKGLDNAMDYIVEESEDSSLDSNLSQVQPDEIAKELEAFPKYLPNGQSSSSYIQESVAYCDISADVAKPNGFNGSTYDGRPESVVFHADQSPDASLPVQSFPDHGDVPSKNIFCLDDHLNSTKVAPNPFMGVTEGNPFTSNPF